MRDRWMMLAAVGALALTGCKERNWIVMRNGTTMEVKANLDGKDYAIPPNQVVPVEIPSGAHTIQLTGYMWHEDQSFDLSGGDRNVVYNIGGKPDLVLVGAAYGKGDTTVRPLATPLTVLEPNEFLVRHYVNEMIPQSSQGSKSGFKNYFLCTYDEDKKAIGCPLEKP